MLLIFYLLAFIVSKRLAILQLLASQRSKSFSFGLFRAAGYLASGLSGLQDLELLPFQNSKSSSFWPCNVPQRLAILELQSAHRIWKWAWSDVTLHQSRLGLGLSLSLSLSLSVYLYLSAHRFGVSGNNSRSSAAYSLKINFICDRRDVVGHCLRKLLYSVSKFSHLIVPLGEEQVASPMPHCVVNVKGNGKTPHSLKLCLFGSNGQKGNRRFATLCLGSACFNALRRRLQAR